MKIISNNALCFVLGFWCIEASDGQPQSTGTKNACRNVSGAYKEIGVATYIYFGVSSTAVNEFTYNCISLQRWCKDRDISMFEALPFFQHGDEDSTRRILKKDRQGTKRLGAPDNNKRQLQDHEVPWDDDCVCQLFKNESISFFGFEATELCYFEGIGFPSKGTLDGAGKIVWGYGLAGSVPNDLVDDDSAAVCMLSIEFLGLVNPVRKTRRLEEYSCYAQCFDFDSAAGGFNNLAGTGGVVYSYLDVTDPDPKRMDMPYEEFVNTEILGSPVYTAHKTAQVN